MTLQEYLAKLKKERQAISTQIRSLIDEFTGKEMPETKKTELRNLESQFDSMGDDISRVERMIAAEEKTDPTPAPTPGSSDDSQRVIEQERERTAEIIALCREFGIDSNIEQQYIKDGSSIDKVRAAVLEQMKERNKPPAGNFRVEVIHEEADKIREAASDAILLRAGRIIEKPAEGAKDLRGMSLRDLAIDCAVRSGITNAHRMTSDELFRSVLTPDSQFASILSSSVNKSMATSYKAAPTTYQLWTGRGSNPDFKAATHYQISEAGDLEKMTQTGEFKFDEMRDLGVNKALATFGKRFGLSRQAFINDDIGVLTKIPEAYVRAARRGINRLVYRMLGQNPIIYDGVNLFAAEHNNMGAAALIGTTAIDAGRTAMRRQTNLRGIETLNISPRYIITPASRQSMAEQFIQSTSDPNALNSGTANIFRSLVPISDAELDQYSLTAWYLAADAQDIDTIEVTYLNGDDMPKLESRVSFEYLGMEWRIYIDYGVTVLDYRGLYCNPGL